MARHALIRPFAQSRPVPPIRSAVDSIRPRTASRVVATPPDRSSPARPATCGEAMLVPLFSAYPPPGTVLRIGSPGAATSTQVPVVDQRYFVSWLVVPATAMQVSYHAG